MGNPEFNGKKFDYWSDEPNNEYGVWNNDMRCKHYVFDWDGFIAPAPSKENAIAKAKELNKLQK